MPRSKSIRWHLFQVLLVTIVPIGLLASGLFYLHWKAQEKTRETAQIEAARLLATAVDNALDSTVQRAQIFARLWAASEVPDRAIHEQAREALAANPDWSAILAFRVDGRGVFRTDAAPGVTVAGMRLFDTWRPVIEERRPVVTDIFDSPQRQLKTVGVGVPVVRDGKVTHVLVVRLKLSWFDQLLTRQRLQDGGVAGIFDRNWKFVARGQDGEARRGTDPSAPLIADMRKASEGAGKYHSLDGVPVYSAWAPTRYGWRVAFATPAAPVDAVLRDHLILFGIVWLVVVLGGVVYAVRKGRHISSSLEALEAQAAELARGARLPNLPASHVREVDHALRALEQASGVLQQTAAERDHSLLTERDARAAAEAANRNKDAFLAMLGHELRNPIAAVSYAAQVMKSERRTPEQVDFAADVIARQTHHLKRLIDDLLDVSRVMRGKIVLERAPLDLAATVRRAIATLQDAGRLAERHVEVSTAPAWIHGDATRVEQIIGNLLVNAATYTSRAGRIRVRVALENGEAVFQIADDGQGIAPEHLPRVFELFYQAEPTIDRATGGLGIGLTLVQQLAELHGGSVTAQSPGKGQGATFTVRIPATSAPGQSARAAAQPMAAVRRTVLLVEDNPDAREGLRMALELDGHKVLEAPDAKTGLSLLDERPEVAVVDIGLPDMNGHEFARRARAKAGTTVRLIALTGFGGEAEEKLAREAGFDRHLTKPVVLSELAAALSSPAPRSEPASRRA